ncbi:monooxygenase [Bradyrhizobium pachyrhizi]|uniref:monooxygenase n=1 Tax=Bradyrhizobium pachyrhizi TaxID=280333 RepID=UPI003D368675
MHRYRSIRPSEANRRTVHQGWHGQRPTYRKLATKGLIRKDYLNGEAGTGGVYLWESREAAEAWFTEAKIAELTERFGARPRLTWYDTHVTVDNLTGETRVNQTALISAAE